jgi:hypothetical protein
MKGDSTMKNIFRNKNKHLSIVGLLFCLSVFNYVYTKYSITNANSTVRLALTLCLWEKGSVEIDQYRQFSIDTACRGEHYYSASAPGVSFLAIPVVGLTHAVLRQLGRAKHLDAFDPNIPHEPNCDYKLLLFAGSLIVSVLCAAGVCVLYLLFRQLGTEKKTAVMLTLLFGFGTPFANFATTMFGHSLAAAFFLFGLAFGFSRRDFSFFRWFGTGLILAYTVWIEYTAAIPACLIGVLFIFVMKKEGISVKQILLNTFFMFLGAFPIAVGFFIYNTLAFGSLFQTGYHFVSTNFPKMDEGFYGIRLPVLSVFWDSLFGIQDGLFVRCPLLIFSPILALHHIVQNRFRSLNIVCFLIPIYYFLLNSAYAYPAGRHLTASLPFLVIPIGLAWDALGRYLKTFLFTLLGINLLIGLVAMNVPVTDTMETSPFRIQFIFQQFFAGRVRNLFYYTGMNAYVSLAVLLFVWVIAGRLLWQSCCKNEKDNNELF